MISNPPENTINKLIDLFKTVNPCYEILFKNKTQRASIERMIKKFGNKDVERIIKAIPKHVGKPFCPKITTPYQLETKLGALFIYFRSLKEEKKTEKDNYQLFPTFITKKTPAKGLKQLRKKVKKF